MGCSETSASSSPTSWSWQPEVGLDPILDRREAQFLEPCDLALGERVVTQVGRAGRAIRQAPRRGAPSLSIRLAPECRRALGAEALEPIGVQLTFLDAETIGALLGLQAIGDDLPDLRDVDLEGVRGGRRRIIAPQVVDQLLRADRLVSCRSSSPSRARGLWPFALIGGPVQLDLERAENAEFHGGRVLHRVMLRLLQVVFRRWKHPCRTRKRAPPAV